MELQLQPQADVCFVTGTAFQPGDRVVSFLVRDAAGEFRRLDCLAAAETNATPPGELLCRWSRTFKPPGAEANPELALKLTAESLFLSLTEEGVAAVEENGALKQFLALMLERKRVVKNRGHSAGGHLLYEHIRSHRTVEVPAAAMDAAFFAGVRDKLGVLLGERPQPRTMPSPAEAAPAADQQQAQQ